MIQIFLNYKDYKNSFLTNKVEFKIRVQMNETKKVKTMKE